MSDPGLFLCPENHSGGIENLTSRQNWNPGNFSDLRKFLHTET